MVVKSWRMKWAGNIARIGNLRNACKILVGKPEGKRAPGRNGRRWKDNIRMDLREVGWKNVDWIHLAPDRDQW
jgi:hypothetical protein